MKHGLAFILFTLCATVLAQIPPPTPLPTPSFNHLPTARVLRVIDGDTVELELPTPAGQPQTLTCRLLGVDTPETVHPTQPVQAYGKEASLFLDNLLKGEQVWIEQDPGNTQDRYGRTLAYLYRKPDGLFINLEIIRQGYGHAYTQYPFKHLELFRQHEKKAREAQKGLWKTPETQTTTLSHPAASTRTTTPQTPPAAQIQAPPTTAKPVPPATLTVYRTASGDKYHRAGCRYLAKSSLPLSKPEAIGRGLTACSVCRP